MRQIFLLLSAVLITSFAGAQASKAYIEVRGMAKVPRTVKSYILDILISEDLSTGEANSYDSIKNAFFTAAKAAGYKEDRFREDQLGYALLQYPGKGSMYHFETSNEADIIKLHRLAGERGSAVSIASRRIRYEPVTDMDRIYTAAFADGKQRAEKIAKTMGKKLGQLIAVVDYSAAPMDTEETSYYKQTDDTYYYLSAQFAIE
ncbi:SIMPL domain-containing protein [Niabella beijingensis]|uniref:SIMPL domain-containing protein n=1 Tax=Niabella beijingensis TaxID=2872700 RepID=UPI001CC11C6F|nr:SIMPL domain-containing protein [Niabella beijingensis]MBZ4191959.1 SIMPL domain-containing protein [Niabella beijingensis]